MYQRIVQIIVLIAFIQAMLLAGLAGQAAAQQNNQPGQSGDVMQELPADKVGEKASQLLERINSDAKDGQRYVSAMQNANPEDRLVIELQLYSLRQRIMADLHLLADTLFEIEKDGPQPELRKQVEAVMVRATPRLWSEINRLRNRIDALRASRAKAPVEELPAIELEIVKLTSRLDTFFELGLIHIAKMEQIELDTTQSQATFNALVLERTDALSGRIALALDRIADLETLRKELPDDAGIANRLIASGRSLDTNAASLEVMLGLMEKRNLDTTSYRAQLVEATRDFSSGLTDTGTAVSLAGRALERTKTWLVESGPKFFLKLVLFVIILIAFHFIKRLVKAGLERALSTEKVTLSQLARRMIISLVSNLIMVFGLLIALSQLGISLGPLLAGLGVAGFIVGFALQDSLSNFASGVMILIYRPYDVGDLVDVGGVYGKVHKMSLVSTNITTLDNQMIVVPNNKIWGDVIKNVTAQDIRRVDMVFGIAYSDDIEKAEGVLNDILTSHQKILDDPKPMVRLHTLNDSSVDFIVRPWAKAIDYWDVYWDVTKSVKLRFDQEGISIPFPQRDVHIINESQTVGQIT